MVSSLDLPDPSPTADVWGEELNAAITAVNADVETNKVQIAANAALLAGKADASAVSAALATKASNADLATKADISTVEGKADASVVNAELASINAELTTKASDSEMDSLALVVNQKADTSYVDTELAEKADVTDIPPEPLFLKEGELVPVGTMAETVIYRTLDRAEDVKVTHLSNNNSEPITNFELPDDLAVGDVLMAIAVTTGSGRTYTWAAPWTEIFDFSQQRTTSAAIYRIVDQAALDDLTTPVITPSGNFDSMVLAILKIEAQVETAWPAYGSGNGRSGNTLTSPSTTGFGISSIATSPFSSFDKEWVFAAAYSTILGGPAPTITLPAGFETMIDATTGGLRFKMGRRFSNTLPVAALSIGVSHVPSFANSNYGGAHFVTPTKEA